MKNHSCHTSLFLEKYGGIKLHQVSGRYLHYGHIEDSLKMFSENLKVNITGYSTWGIPIHSFKFGEGPTKILAWSQMHGNESTTTKAVLDIINGIYLGASIFEEILTHCTICMIPMLNPDGAKAYTRENANSVDLNRDAQNLSQVESQVLRKIFDDFQPDFCFNLHDQRTIFSAGERNSPATISFLTPAMDEERSVTYFRKQSMKVIALIAQELDMIIPGSVGRYDDAFNLNCTGDTFQNSGVPTILFEAGHFPGDYEREETRKLMGATIFSALNAIASGIYTESDPGDYFKIPQNEKLFMDVLLKNALIGGERVEVGIQFREVLENEKIVFVPVIQKIGPDLKLYGHKEIDCKNQPVHLANKSLISENDIVKEIYINNELLAIN